MESRGGISGGLTIAEALLEFESQGYVGQFVVRPSGILECTACGEHHQPQDVPLEQMERTEGASDPADMVFIGALRCPGCGQSGTAVVPFGPTARPEDGDFLRQLDDHRQSVVDTQGVDDGSMVKDSGWLLGPDG